MMQILLPIGFIVFGIFLKKTKLPGFERSRRFSTFFIVLGILTLISGIILMYLKSRQ